MPKLNIEFLQQKLKYINSIEARKLKKDEYDKWIAYNGNLKPLLIEKINKEFKKKETIEELIHRMLPLNLIRKIINKLAQVYNEAPIREIGDQNESDGELLEQYEDILLMNIRMQEANRHFKLFKKVLGEMYVDDIGYPRFRVLPPHTYFAFSHSMVSPEKPDNIWKVLSYNEDPSKQKYAVYTDEEFMIIDGRGELQREEMQQLNNNESINPYGKMPFVYIVDSSISVEPIPDDDLIGASIAIPIVLTDLLFGIKYQAWSLIYLIGVDQDIEIGPNSIAYLPKAPDGSSPEIGQLKPDIDIDGTLRVIESAVAYLLSSKSLKTDTLSGKLTTDNAASGISKAIDNAEVAEDKKEQQAYFIDFETKLWELISKYLIPEWRKSNVLNANINKDFSPGMTVNIQLRDPKVTITEQEQINISKTKIDGGFSTHKRELYMMYPDKTEEEIDLLLQEIIEEQKYKQQIMIEDLGMKESEETEDNGREG